MNTDAFTNEAHSLYYQGMLDYETICERVLMSTGLPEDQQDYIQIRVLDAAQRIFENQMELNR